MSKLSRLAALLLAGAILSTPALAADKGKGIATVNGQPVSQAAFDIIVAQQTAQGAPDTPEVKNAVKDRMITLEVITQEAKKKGLEKRQDVQVQTELARQGILVNAYMADYARTNPISEDRLKKDYEAIKSNLGTTEYKTRHILVESEEEAKGIIAKLDKGDKFSELAKASKDPGSKDKGGDLGWISPASGLVKPFIEAMTKLKKGEYTKTPVKTNFGYHIIQLEDTRPLTPPTYEQVKPQLQQNAQQQQFEQHVKKLRDAAKIN